MFEDLVPIAAIVMVFGIPIVAILTSHQRKMAELIHGRQGVEKEESARLRYEVADLRERMNQQTLMLDDIRTRLEALPVARAEVASPPDLEQRLRG